MKVGDILKETKHLEFRYSGKKPKTIVVDVFNKSDEWLGVIEWYSQWRQYCFVSHDDIVYAKSCLQDIVEMIQQLMDERN